MALRAGAGLPGGDVSPRLPDDPHSRPISPENHTSSDMFRSAALEVAEGGVSAQAAVAKTVDALLLLPHSEGPKIRLVWLRDETWCDA